MDSDLGDRQKWISDATWGGGGGGGGGIGVNLLFMYRRFDEKPDHRG